MSAPNPQKLPPFQESRLFQLDNGRPMYFYIRPGTTKMELAPLILRQGGRLHFTPEPSSILLAKHDEVPEGETRAYISASYITDCIARKTRLPLKNYLLNPQLRKSKRGLVPFTEAEDRAIMLYVQNSKEQALTGNLTGTTFWMDMAEARVTPHPWQAMRDRYLRHLQNLENTYQPGRNPKRIVPRPRPCYKVAGKEQVPRTPNIASVPNMGPADAAQDLGQTTGASKLPSIFQMANKEFEDSEEGSENLRPREEIAAEEEMPPDPKKQAVESTNCEHLAMSESLLPAEKQPSGPSAKKVALAVEDMKRLMEEFGVDLVTVTQAFLKNSGDVAAAACYLRTGQRPDGCPLWTRQDDLDLMSGADDLRSKLVAKYGEQNVNAREVFRKS